MVVISKFDGIHITDVMIKLKLLMSSHGVA